MLNATVVPSTGTRRKHGEKSEVVLSVPYRKYKLRLDCCSFGQLTRNQVRVQRVKS